MIRLGVSGTNWTGKTTTLKVLLQGCESDNALISLSTIVHTCPFPTSQHQTLEASEWVLGQLEVMEARLPENTKISWYDRTPLDILAYSLYAYNRSPGPRSQAKLEALKRALVTKAGEFFQIFQVERTPDWPQVNPKPSNSDISFALYMEQYLNNASRALHNVARLNAALPDRIDQLRQVAQRALSVK